VALAALGATALFTPTLLAPAASATPDNSGSKPTLAEVQKQLGELALQNAQLVDKYDQAQTVFDSKSTAAKVAEAVSAKADKAFASARAQLGAAAAAQYEGGSFSATGALLSSQSGASYIDQLTTLSMISSHTAQIVSNLTVVQKKADSAKKQSESLLKDAKAKRDALATKKKSVQAQLDKYSALLDTLTAAQRVTYQATINPPVAPVAVTTAVAKLPHIDSKAAAQAVRFALAQVGKPYVFGAAGPGSYDCSGLTMAAWGSAGVSLPHSAEDQYNYGTRISFAQLAPGDLLFYYQPIGHVTIYIGDGLMVSAPQTGEDVKVAPAVQTSEYVGATRLTG
jgi:cell wall-associated NlpC family hydrolase